MIFNITLLEIFGAQSWEFVKRKVKALHAWFTWLLLF